MATGAPSATIRIDKLLWFLRLAPTRSAAAGWAGEGHMRLNGRRIDRPGTAIRIGDVMVLPMRRAVVVIELLSIPARRGPAIEAQGCYRRIDLANDGAVPEPDDDAVPEPDDGAAPEPDDAAMHAARA